MAAVADPRPTPPRAQDRAARRIAGANVLAVAITLWDGGGVLTLLWPYWIQSVTIGYFSWRRLGALRRFRTDGLTMDGEAVAPTPGTRRRAARFFALHYGFFHVVYLVFLISFTGSTGGSGSVASTGGPAWTTGDLTPLELAGIAVVAAGFWWSHRTSHRDNVEADLAGRPNIGTLMFLPYLRVIPMHGVIVLGAFVNPGGGAVLFGALKTVADILMHKVEHRLLQAAAHRTVTPA